MRIAQNSLRVYAWNQKNLDYEIETGKWLRSGSCFRLPMVLKSKESRLRDWNKKGCFSVKKICFSWNQKNLDYEIETKNNPMQSDGNLALKSKESRLRDWNTIKRITPKVLMGCLEIKRISITRLKRWFWCYLCPQSRIWLEIKRISITRLKLRIPERSPTHFRTLKSKESRLRDWNSCWQVV